MENVIEDSKLAIPEHHIQQELCTTRPLYRQGRKLTAVKVYTINNESQHLLLYGVPELKLNNEIQSLCMKYGELKHFEIVKQYIVDKFTECHHAHFRRIQSARIAKRFLDNKSFYGGILHVCYAPEYETLAETKEKLMQRQKDVSSRITSGPSQLEYANFESVASTSQQNRKRKHPALPITEKRLKLENSDIWNGIPRELDPRLKDPLYINSKNVIRKHFQMSDANKFLPLYGPSETEKDKVISVSSELEYDNNYTTVLPKTIIKNDKPEYSKRIVFRKKIINIEKN